MTKIIKIADNHYRYGETNMEIAMTGGCDRCILDNICHGAEYIGCNLRSPACFQLKEDKMESKIFVIDNGNKQFKAKLWLEERNVCFQVLEQENILTTLNVVRHLFPSLREGLICIRGLDSINHFKPSFFTFDNNTDRDAYFIKAYTWLQEFIDVNSKPESKFDVYDVEFNGISMAFSLDGHEYSVSSAMNWDNFAGIEYKGFDHEWKLCRVVISAGCLVSETEIIDENIKQAIPTRIRFFKDAKCDKM